MYKPIMNFSGFVGGWMNMHIWDYRTEEERKTRISYIQDFFDDLLMMCKYLLSPITGIYEVFIDQEGYDSSIRCNKYQTGLDAEISVELRIPVFEDEGKTENELVDNWLYYNNIYIRDFVGDILSLIKEYKDDYNRGFVLSPSNELNEDLFDEVRDEYFKFAKEVNYEEISNT